MTYIIYKIYNINDNINDFYIGKTNNLLNRIRQHKTSCNNVNDKEYHKLLYTKIRETGGFDNWKFETIEDVESDDKKYILQQERYYIDKLKPTLNKNHNK